MKHSHFKGDPFNFEQILNISPGNIGFQMERLRFKGISLVSIRFLRCLKLFLQFWRKPLDFKSNQPFNLRGSFDLSRGSLHFKGKRLILTQPIVLNGNQKVSNWTRWFPMESFGFQRYYWFVYEFLAFQREPFHSLSFQMEPLDFVGSHWISSLRLLNGILRFKAIILKKSIAFKRNPFISKVVLWFWNHFSNFARRLWI